MKKKLASILLLLTLMPGAVSFAQDATVNKPTTDATVNKPATQTNQPAQKLQNPLKVDSIKAVILLAVDIMIYVGIAFAILAIIFVGFKFVMAQGNPDKISEAKEWFLYIIIGLAVLISARVIVDIVQNTLTKSGVVNENLWKP